jgi:serine protease Do
MLRSLFAALSFCLFIQSVSAKELPDFTDLVEKQGASVVNVSTTQIVRNNGMPNIPENDPYFEFFRRFYPPVPREQETQSLGSGFIISADGYILTNAHVVNHADKVTVRLGDKREFKAKLIGADKRTDVALLKIEASGLPVVAVGDPAQLKVGEWVLAIGSPFGFDSSVTAGIVSAKGRSLPQENYVPFIQTDVAINPGNSGGPLFNMKGEVVGINSQIYSRSGGYMGLSFAIPIDVAMEVAKQLKASGKVTRGRIGVTIQEVTREVAESFGLRKAAGGLVSSVEKGGPADKGGIKLGDIVLQFNGKAIGNSNELPRLVAAVKPGSKATLQVWRKGETHELTVEVGEMPDDNQVAQRGGENAPTLLQAVPRLGIAASELTAEQRRELQVNGGLLVEEAKGSGVRDLRRGDVILAVGTVEAHSVAELNEILKPLPKGRNVALLLRRGGTISYLAVQLDQK